MAYEEVSGKILYDAVIARLGGYGNAFDSEVIFGAINDGKDEVWAILKELNDEYFLEETQNSDAAADDYFANLAVNTREYDLPENLAAIKFIEVTNSGYEDVEFVYRDMGSEDFKAARRDSTASNTTQNTNPYYYTIGKQNRLIMAQFPEIAFALRIWYIKAWDDIETDQDIVDFAVAPYVKKIADFAVKRLVLALKDPELFSAWREEWRSSVVTFAQAAAPRNQADPEFVEDFLG